MSFLKIGDRAAGAIKSGGTTRRAAKMVIVDADHPTSRTSSTGRSSRNRKWRPSSRLKALGQASESDHQRRASIAAATATPASTRSKTGAEARDQSGAQVANYDNSIQRAIHFARQGYTQSTSRSTTPIGTARRTTRFRPELEQLRSRQRRVLKAVANDGDWRLTRRTDGKVTKTLKARGLWDKIAEAAWQCADPGLQFHTTINDWHTCPASDRSAPAIRARSTFPRRHGL